MNDEPQDFNSFQETMDSRLQQLERELFSLTPAEAPRYLASRLDGQFMPPLPVSRSLAGGAAASPFRWRRMVVPAAAAVVVVSVFYRLDGHPGSSPSLAQQAGQRAPGPKVAAPPIGLSTGYVLRAEPVYVSPANWDAADHQYWIQPGSQSGLILSLPQRSPAVLPASFH